MTDQTKLDRILASEEALVPSSGFLASVMDRVREEAAAPPPIPFPWKRVVPGMVLAAIALLWVTFDFVRRTLPALHASASGPPHLAIPITQPLQQAGWVALALGVSMLSWLFARRFAR